jgi:hypothetical protein
MDKARVLQVRVNHNPHRRADDEFAWIAETDGRTDRRWRRSPQGLEGKRNARSAKADSFLRG